MSNYSKAKLSSGSVYDIVTGGLRASDEKMVLIVLPGERSLTEVDAEFDMAENVSRIEILDSAGEVMDIKKGYAYMSGCEKHKDFVIDHQAIEMGSDETGDPVVEYQDVTGTVMVITLEKADVRKELDAANAKIAGLEETVDMLVVANLEG